MDGSRPTTPPACSSTASPDAAAAAAAAATLASTASVWFRYALAMASQHDTCRSLYARSAVCSSRAVTFVSTAPLQDRGQVIREIHNMHANLRNAVATQQHIMPCHVTTGPVTDDSKSREGAATADSSVVSGRDSDVVAYRKMYTNPSTACPMLASGITTPKVFSSCAV